MQYNRGFFPKRIHEFHYILLLAINLIYKVPYLEWHIERGIYEPDPWLFYINFTSVESLALKCYLLIYLFFYYFPLIVCFLWYYIWTLPALQVCLETDCREILNNLVPVILETGLGWAQPFKDNHHFLLAFCDIL